MRSRNKNHAVTDVSVADVEANVLREHTVLLLNKDDQCILLDIVQLEML